MKVTPLNLSNLYRTTVFEDFLAGQLFMYEPILMNGTFDGSRPILFAGQTNINTPKGSIPLRFGIDVPTIDEAFSRWTECCQFAFEQFESQMLQQQLRATGGAPINPKKLILS